MRFRFIEDRRADYPVKIMCGVLGVSPAGYYAWRARPESQRSAANRELVDDIKRVHRDTNGRYGSPRIHAELRAQGRGASRGRIERLMRRHGIRAIMARPRRVRTTDSRHDFPIAANLLERNFIATATNQIWLADITYVETDQGWLYLATVMDLYSRKIVGWAMADHLRAELPLAALAMAIATQRPGAGLIHARPPSICSNPACNARPVHTKVPTADMPSASALNCRSRIAPRLAPITKLR